MPAFHSRVLSFRLANLNAFKFVVIKGVWQWKQSLRETFSRRLSLSTGKRCLALCFVTYYPDELLSSPALNYSARNVFFSRKCQGRTAHAHFLARRQVPLYGLNFPFRVLCFFFLSQARCFMLRIKGPSGACYSHVIRSTVVFFYALTDFRARPRAKCWRRPGDTVSHSLTRNVKNYNGFLSCRTPVTTAITQEVWHGKVWHSSKVQKNGSLFAAHV